MICFTEAVSFEKGLNTPISLMPMRCIAGIQTSFEVIVGRFNLAQLFSVYKHGFHKFLSALIRSGINDIQQDNTGHTG